MRCRYTVYSHGAYMRQSVERALHNAGYGIPVQVPVKITFRIYIDMHIYIYGGEYRFMKRHKSFYSQGLKIRQPGEHLVVNLPQPVLRQQSTKRELVIALAEIRVQGVWLRNIKEKKRKKGEFRNRCVRDCAYVENLHCTEIILFFFRKKKWFGEEERRMIKVLFFLETILSLWN